MASFDQAEFEQVDCSFKDFVKSIIFHFWNYEQKNETSDGGLRVVNGSIGLQVQLKNFEQISKLINKLISFENVVDSLQELVVSG